MSNTIGTVSPHRDLVVTNSYVASGILSTPEALVTCTSPRPML